MYKAKILDIKIAVDELIEEGIYEDCDEINVEMLKVIIKRATEIANED